MAVEVTEVTVWAVIALVVVLGVFGGGVTLAVLKAAAYPPPTMLIIVMSMLTIMFTGGLILVGNVEVRQVLGTMAATALGSLVTAVTASFGLPRRARVHAEDDDDPHDD